MYYYQTCNSKDSRWETLAKFSEFPTLEQLREKGFTSEHYPLLKAGKPIAELKNSKIYYYRFKDVVSSS